ncbi:MAG: tyrosine-type recombinase/integrase [bacterium]|nr:tyrosine-type recombinase/integrase [bacterium]
MMTAVDSYLAVRRAAGFDLSGQEYLLRSFARFAEKSDETHVRTATAIEWAGLGPSPAQRDARLRTVVRLARHAHLEDAGHEVPPSGFFGYRKKRRLPFIYSKEDIERLIGAAARLRPTTSLRPHTYRTFFALLAVTGLRLSEGRGLRLEDVTKDGLIIRKAKFQKTRLVPLHETAAAGLDGYIVQRRRLLTTDDHVFVSNSGRPLARQTVYSTFLRLLKSSDLLRAGDRRPRIQDLRHSFAVRALEACPEGRDNVGQHMLALSTYMGHASIKCTYWYLEVTPHLMQDISVACEAFHMKERA